MSEKNKESEILEAAEKEFMSKGFYGAKTTAIAKIAGVTHAMLHYYFRTKANLFSKVFDAKLSLLGESITFPLKKSELSVLEKIKEAIEAHFDFMERNSDLPKFVISEMISKPEYRAVIINKISEMAGPHLENWQRELDAEADRGVIERVKIIDILVDIVSLNIFVFLAYPILVSFAVEPYGGREKFLAARKRENVELIMRRLIKR